MRRTPAPKLPADAPALDIGTEDTPAVPSALAPALTPGEERAERQGRAAVLGRLAEGGEARARAGRMLEEARAKRPEREE